jgi:hypothetical protein
MQSPAEAAPTGEMPQPEGPDAQPPQPMAGTSNDQMPGEEIPLVPDQKKPKGARAEIEKVAKDYVIPMSESGLDQWAKASKGEGIKAFTDYATQVACGLYPTFAPQIQAGVPTNVLLDPYIQIAMQVLGPMMSEPDWTSEKWNKALQGGTDPKTGRSVPMTLDQWKKYLMTEPSHGWDQTPQAIDKAGKFIDALHTSFGHPAYGGE